MRHLQGLLELLQIRAGVSETFAMTCDISLLVLLAWLKETQVIISARKRVMNKASKDGAHHLKVQKPLE